jgi:iron complex outermembrane receptor protein
MPVLTEFLGTSDYRSERLSAYEIGYRAQPKKKVTFDFAGFYNIYKDHRSLEPGTVRLETSPLPVHLLNPITFGNLLRGEGYGFETAVNWRVLPFWTLSPSYSLARIDFRREPGSRDTLGMAVEIASPKHQAQLRSDVKLPHHLELNAFAAFVDRVRNTVPGYTRVDARIAWRGAENLEFSVGGQNLLQSQHAEYTPFLYERATEVQRSFYAKVKWQF